MSDKGLVTARLLLRVAIGVVIVAEVVLALGVGLQALDANPEAGFTEWAYRNQDRLMTPFEDMFEDSTIGDSEGVLDVSGLFAMAVFASLFIPLGMALAWVQRNRIRNEERAHEAAEAAQRARMFGGEPLSDPEPPAVERPSLGQRVRSLFDRGETPKPSEPVDPTDR